MPSILCVTYDTSTGLYKAGLLGSAQISDGAITSGKLASGIVGTVHLRDLNVTSAKLAAAIIGLLGTVADEAITSAKLASGAVGGNRIWTGAIVSAHIGANVIGGIHILDGVVVSAKIGTGVVGGVLLQDAGVLSGKIAANAIGGDTVWNWGITSGKYASGSITEQSLVSGISIDIAETVEDPGYRAREAISSFCCVFIAGMSGNYVGIAKALSGSMPAIGITAAAITSNALGVIKYGGRVAAPTAVVSGQQGKPVFVGSDGQLKITPPSTSGYCQQIMGAVKDDDEIFLFPEPGYIEIA